MTKLEIIQHKIIEPANLNALISLWRFKDEKIVFTNGCFDVLHYGHVSYLSRAADLGTKLIIGLNTDTSVKKLKGENRPINGEQERAFTLAAFSFIDAIILFDQDTPFQLISEIKPDVLVKGGDYRIEDIVGYDVVKANGGVTKTIDFIQGFSSTKIIEKSGL